MFSAAIPGQGGRGHKNEQWQSYRATHFAANGFDAFDVFRPALQRDRRILPWFRQNVLLFLREGTARARDLSDDRVKPEDTDMILPECHRKVVRRTRRAFKKKLDDARRALENA